MMNPWMILGAVLVILGAYLAGNRHGHQAEATAWTARIEKERADASEAARKTETMWQETVNGTVRNYETKLAGVRGTYAAALDGLRDRPERAAGLPDHPRTGCAGATGAELSGPDGRFLAGEAARADEIRAGLVACYEVIDTLR